MSTFVVVLTATIDPRGCLNTKRCDPRLREQDYLDSLILWLSKTSFKIVFCENSGYSLTKLRALAKQFPGRVEFMHYLDASPSRVHGKSLGEMHILKHVLADSKFIKNADWVIKVTGRVFIENISELVAQVKPPLVVGFVSGVQLDLHTGVQSVVFIATKPFFAYLFAYESCLSEENHFYFEHALTEAISDATNKGYAAIRLPAPKYIGFSATHDVAYQKLYLHSPLAEHIVHGMLLVPAGVRGPFVRALRKLFSFLKDE